MLGKILNGKYKFERHLGEGGCGHVYLCRNLQLGNLWAIKHISKEEKKVQLIAEIETLKKLNHIYLPQIVDIIEDDGGTYIVRSYIEGTDLGKKLENEGPFDEKTVITWAKQLCEALIYLHNMDPYPIIYRDMKPENVIITRDNMAIIVDFGTSKEYKESDPKDINGARTPCYAAPEQMAKNGVSDRRTDIYSLGVTLHNLLTGYLPEELSESSFEDKVSPEMSVIIQKCINEKPEDRYQTIEDLKCDLDSVNSLNPPRPNYRNIAIILGSVIMSVVSLSMVYLGLIGLYKERLAVVDIYPETMVLSIQQEGEFDAEKSYPDGTKKVIKSSEIKWACSNQDVALVKNGKVQAVNGGEAELTGTYGDKILKTTVRVNKRQDDIDNVNVYLKYLKNYYVSPFAGIGEHTDPKGDVLDGEISKCIIAEPISIAVAKNNEIFVSDLSKLRVIKDGIIKTLDLDMQVKVVRADLNGDVYFSMQVFQNAKQELESGIYKYENDKVTKIYGQSDIFDIADFSFDSSGNIYILELSMNDSLEMHTKVVFLNAGDKKDVVLRDISGLMDSITVDKNDDIYISCAENGAIYKWEKGSQVFKYFAGQEKAKHYVDGKNNRFFAPQKILAKDDYIYVLDQNVLRRISLEDGRLVDVETLAGQIEKGKKNIKETKGIDSRLNKPKDIAIDMNGNILVADGKNSVIWNVVNKK